MKRLTKTLCIAILTGIIALVGCGWWVWNRWFSERANPSEELYPIRGIDISAHNGDINFSTLAANGVDFAYIKATEGTDFIDRKFAANADSLHHAGIPTGAYHFFRFDTDGELQAWNFVRALENRHFTLPTAIDLEEWGNDKSASTARILTQLRIFIKILNDNGYQPVIYTNKDGYNRFVRGHLDRYPIWICSFTDPPLDNNKTQWHIWQYSHRGSIEGVSGFVDLNTIHPDSHIARMIEDYKTSK